MKLNVTVVNSATTCRVFQNIENFAQYKGKTVTLSARIKTSAANVKIALYDGATFTESSAHTGGGAWETLSLTYTLSASASALAAYAGFLQTTVNTGAVYIDSVMLVMGSSAVTFVPEDIEIGLARCQRYYEKSYDLLTVPGTNTATNINRWTATKIGTNQMLTANHQFKVQKYTSPTMVIYATDGTSGKADWTSTAGVTTQRTTSANSTGTKGFAMFQSVTEEPTADAHYTADAAY